ncbi:NAD-dependent deacylase [Citricoccus sp. GCM10030269]|uniref:NAD-dependent deacylase n=1 Tax=Citricoccus sp. GCM10030269 TaxID=3273388 RepID=UPI003619C91C
MTDDDVPGLAEAAELARRARRVVVLSGAGMSAESGVPTFREAQTGLWERFSSEELATEEAWLENPALVWSWYQWRARLVRGCSPNAGHRAIATWQRRLAQQPDGGAAGSLVIATQNVDDLHERAGAEVKAHLHGSLFDYHCAECGTPAEHDPSEDDPHEQEPADGPPLCTVCGTGRIRPGVVLFGEMLPEEAFAQTSAALEHCDLAVVVGTSALVQPAATLPYVALGAGAAVVEVNPEVTEFSTAATVHVAGNAGTVLPALVDAPNRSSSV